MAGAPGAKSAEAFRTITEVAEALDTPAHVLRFWESKFSQIKPVKRAGGRRYYRPDDVALIAGIRKLLHDDGITIRGVQKILREHGARHVAGLGGAEGGKRRSARPAMPIFEAGTAAEATTPEPAPAPRRPPVPRAEPEGRFPAAVLLRAMDMAAARDRRPELRAAFERLSSLRDRMARETEDRLL
jgi:DNA-binding transcriptional MerR regulator